MPTSGMAGQRVLLRQNSRTGAFCMGSDYCQKLLADVGGGMITAGSSSRFAATLGRKRSVSARGLFFKGPKTGEPF